MGEPRVRLAIVGAGSRGNTYGHIAASLGAEIVAVADPEATRRERSGDRLDVPPEQRFADWTDLAARPRLADAVVVATPDRLHAPPAVELATLGYHVLLEKPIAPTPAECEQIVAAAERAGVVLAVCHVMRYTAYTQQLKAIIDAGTIGDVVSVEHLEPVGWWHYAHSYVRGNWRREDQSNAMLMAKSCHDLDWLSYVVDRPVRRVSSFGGLYEFRAERRPEGAADRCVDCAIEPGCAYSAPRLYWTAWRKRDLVRNPSDWPLSVITDDPSEASVSTALREGPYGRCVYACDNDVVDHQVVALEYEGGVTASFTMTAFTPLEHRKTRIFGTQGFVDGDGDSFRIVDFRTGRDVSTEVVLPGDASAAGGHGGGDGGLVTAFLEAVATGDTSGILTSGRDSLASHQIVWAAEEARRTGTVVTL